MSTFLASLKFHTGEPKPGTLAECTSLKLRRVVTAADVLIPQSCRRISATDGAPMAPESPSTPTPQTPSFSSSSSFSSGVQFQQQQQHQQRWRPCALAVMPRTGHLLVFDRLARRLLLLDSGGTFIRVVLTGVDCSALAVDVRGRIWITTHNGELAVYS